MESIDALIAKIQNVGLDIPGEVNGYSLKITSLPPNKRVPYSLQREYKLLSSYADGGELVQTIGGSLVQTLEKHYLRVVDDRLRISKLREDFANGGIKRGT